MKKLVFKNAFSLSASRGTVEKSKNTTGKKNTVFCESGSTNKPNKHFLAIALAATASRGKIQNKTTPGFTKNGITVRERYNKKNKETNNKKNKTTRKQ